MWKSRLIVSDDLAHLPSNHSAASGSQPFGRDWIQGAFAHYSGIGKDIPGFN
ncbi:MAG: hypothetical protein ACLGP3_01180 [Acidobacteriota bacterium]